MIRREEFLCRYKAHFAKKEQNRPCIYNNTRFFQTVLTNLLDRHPFAILGCTVYMINPRKQRCFGVLAYLCSACPTFLLSPLEPVLKLSLSLIQVMVGETSVFPVKYQVLASSLIAYMPCISITVWLACLKFELLLLRSQPPHICQIVS